MRLFMEPPPDESLRMLPALRAIRARHAFLRRERLPKPKTMPSLAKLKFDGPRDDFVERGVYHLRRISICFSLHHELPRSLRD
jgi:hypothetical protein